MLRKKSGTAVNDGWIGQGFAAGILVKFKRAERCENTEFSSDFSRSITPEHEKGL